MSNRIREKKTGHTDDQRAKEYMKVVEDRFHSAKGNNIRYMFLDAHCDDEEADEEEKMMFEQAMEDIYTLLEALPKMYTDNVQKVWDEMAHYGIFTTRSMSYMGH